MGGGQSSGGANDWSSNLSQGGYQQPSQFNWGTLGQGLQRTGSAYAQSGGGAGTYGAAAAMARMDPMARTPPTDVNDQGVVIGTDKRIYDKESLQSLVDALNRIDATALAMPPRDFRPNPTKEYAMPTAGGLFGYDEGQNIGF
jgi:hypothetical protein